MTQYFHPDSDLYRKWGLEPPKAISHGVNDTPEHPLGEQLTRLMPHSWRLEGNQLIGMTDIGELRQFIPTDYILVGSDHKGLPIFKHV